MKTAIGIDIGGTKILIALGTSAGKILAQSEIPTQKDSHTQACVQEMISVIQELIRDSGRRGFRVQGIGVGIPGPVNTEKGVVPRSPHLAGWRGMPLRKILKDRFRIPVILANDANAAAVGESVFGGGRGEPDFIFVTVSTGIGGGIFANGRLVEGAGYVGGEIGHMVLVPEGDPCFCGNRGCLEAYASGTAMARYAREEMKKGRKSKILQRLVPGTNASRGERLSAKILGAAAKAGDRLALEAYRRGGYYLGIGLANLLNILNPSKVILGGGVLKSAPPVFLGEARRSAKEHAWPEAFRTVKIVKSNLRGAVGCLGALALVFRQPRSR